MHASLDDMDDINDKVILGFVVHKFYCMRTFGHVGDRFVIR